MSSISFKLDLERAVVEVYDSSQQMNNGFFDAPVCIEVPLKDFAATAKAAGAAFDVLEERSQ
jgi:hypothetical protein